MIDFSIPVLSVRQPWPWLIIYAGKDVENRNWYSQFRGRFLIHAAKGCTYDEYCEAKEFAESIIGITGLKDLNFPEYEELLRGGIVGQAEISDCVSKSESPWFVGRYGFMLRNSHPLPFYPCRGELGFFHVKNTVKAG